MITEAEKVELKGLVNSSLDSAENIWKEVGANFSRMENMANNMFSEAVETQIPNHPTIESGTAKVDDFIAIVADMRGSTNHLLQEISSKRAKVSRLERVFYETSALLPALAKAISYKDGQVTEYLGDGVLGLFHAPEEKRPHCIYNAHDAAKKCIATVTDVVNPILEERYSLPELKIGVGLAFSKAVVTLVGLPDKLHPKVFGECVFRATKLSGGENEIYTDEALEHIWPTSKGATLKLVRKKLNGLDGFLITKNQK